MDRIEEWLTSLGLAEYGPRFAENHIDLSILPELTDPDLRELGVSSLGHRRKLLRAIAELVGGAAPAAPPTVEPRPAPPVPTTQAQPAGAERRQLTVMFCDLVGSTALSARLDPEDMREVIRAYQQSCTGVVRTYDGFVAKYMGDGVLIYFGYPNAHEDDAARAVMAGLNIVAAIGGLKSPEQVSLKVRIGIATGVVVVGDLVGEGAAQEQAVVGDTPNLAARLQAMAEPGTIVVAASTRRLLGGLFDLRDLGRHQLKGLVEPVEAWEVAGAAVSETRFAAARTTGVTSFVGREEEVDLLLQRKKLAWQGKGQVVLISGEAGIGKSRIAAWLGERIGDEPQMRLSYQCSPYHRDSALHPFISQLERAAGFKPDDSPEQKRDKLEALLALATSDVAAVAPLFAERLGIPFGDRYPPLNLSPAQHLHQLRAALLDQLEGLARRQPILFLFEDAHWADTSSLEMLDLAVERIGRLPILGIVTFRPEFVPAWAGRHNAFSLTLGRLDRRHARAMAERVASGRRLPPEVLDEIIAKTDGVPLFVEELTKTVLESGLLVEEGDSYRLDGPLRALAIPATLQDSLMARLDRLALVKDVAQVGAAIGREFSYALLRAVVALEEATLLAALAKLEEVGLASCRGVPPEAIYSFKHALVRDVAYESLLKSRRQVLHRRIAEAMRDQFVGLATAEPEIVAHHFTQGGQPETAIEWWGKAGELARRRSANNEAVAHYRNAIGLVEMLGGGPALETIQLPLQVAYAQALMAVREHGAPETTAAYARAAELAAGSDKADDRLSTEYGVWSGSYVRGELNVMQNLSQAFLRNAARNPGSPEEALGKRMVGLSYWFQGDCVGATPYLEQAVAAYDAQRDRPLAFRFGQDIGAAASIYLAIVLWLRGELDRAREFAEGALRLAMQSGHIASIAYAEGHKCIFEAMRHDARRAGPHAEALLKLAREHGLNLWMAIGTFLSGWSRWQAGDQEAGLSGAREGIALCREQKIGIFTPLYVTFVAAMEAASGRAEAALAMLDQCQAEIDRTGQCWIEPELHRQRGEALLRQESADIAAAEAAFQRALDIARRQQARPYELRAALGLARLHRRVGRNETARQELALILSGFSESAEFPEVAEAGCLLQLLQ